MPKPISTSKWYGAKISWLLNHGDTSRVNKTTTASFPDWTGTFLWGQMQNLHESWICSWLPHNSVHFSLENMWLLKNIVSIAIKMKKRQKIEELYPLVLASSHSAQKRGQKWKKGQKAENSPAPPLLQAKKN